MKRPPKVDPAVSFTCANCKRILPNAEKHESRRVCADSNACAAALADWMSKETFAVGVTKP